MHHSAICPGKQSWQSTILQLLHANQGLQEIVFCEMIGTYFSVHMDL